MENLIGQFAQDDLSLTSLLVNLAIGTVLSLVLKLHFEKYSSTMSGKKELARIMPFLVLIICLIISIVKSSLALSLGLVGALSIVRFRTPIKEPEELVYIFMAIAIGLGLGANQSVLTVAATLFILVIVAVVKKNSHRLNDKNLYLSINWSEADGLNPKEVSDIVAKNVNRADLKRHDSQRGQIQLVFFIDIDSEQSVYRITELLKAKHHSIEASFIDQSRVPGI